ncbi:MAG: PKD domain-containing protein [Candidatus Polarisedimenticolaceae bacterium]|nr:PKD domain-containing protein [Candidatus Polarisedimenticolaceae bacterium]
MKLKKTRSQSARRVLFYLLTPLATLVSAPPAYAFNSILNNWIATYPASMTDENASAAGSACALCHVPGDYGQFNGYGWDLKVNGRDFLAVESLNSDSDPTGASNLEEINASTQPGWTIGANNAINGGGVTNSALPPSGITGELDPLAANQPPITNPNGPYSGTEGVSLSFSSTGSMDPDGTITTYEWDFGDGNIGTGSAPSHTYAGTGTFDIILTVTDDAGDMDMATTTATIGAGNQPPTANPMGPYTGTTGTAVMFDGSSSMDSDGTIVSYSWDFGDGSAGSTPTPSHTYATQGTYNITLTVVDDSGAMDSATTSVTIDAANQAPTASASGPYAGTPGVAIVFDGTGSTDPDGTLSSYEWDFGDGTTGTSSTPSHTYAAQGIYNVTLLVTDDAGLTGMATTTATIGMVVNQPPLAVANGPYSGTVGSPIVFSSTGSGDPDGTIVAYEWDFGDGTTGSGSNPTHTYATQGTYNVTLMVTDNDGAMASDSTTATIGTGNQAPVADASGPYSGTVDSAIQFNGAGSSDANGVIVTYEWTFGDGTSGTGPNPSHTYTTPGVYNVTLMVTDDEGAMDSDATTATIAAVDSGADLFLNELWAPESMRLKQGKKSSIKIIAQGGTTSIHQSATVNLSVTPPPMGLSVVIEEASITRMVRPARRLQPFQFEADITCLAAGIYTLGWSATISADQNSDSSNDRVTGETLVLCSKDKDNDDDDDDDDDDDEEEEEEESDD